MNPNRIANLSVLLNENPISYYWIGFLMADGHFYSRGALKLQLSEKDRHHLEKFRRFVNYTGKSKSCLMSAMNPTVVHEIMNKFSITNRKTYEPCDLTWIKNDELLFSLIVGMIDGDGFVKIRNNRISLMGMKMHSSWIHNLRLIESFLYKYFTVKRIFDGELATIPNHGYARILLTDGTILAKMYSKVKKLKLPVLERKWNKIDINYFSLHRKCMDEWPTIKKMVDTGVSYTIIAKKFNTTRQNIAQRVYRHKSN